MYSDEWACSKTVYEHVDQKHQPFAIINIGSISRVQTFSLQVEQSEIISPITWVVMLASLP
jgi:hypothetical protein